MAENLYGAPYWSPNIYENWRSRHKLRKSSEEVETFLKTGDEKEVFKKIDPIRNVLTERIASLRHSGSEKGKLISDIETLEADLLGTSKSGISEAVRNINTFLRQKEKIILDWSLKILKDFAKVEILDENYSITNMDSVEVNFDNPLMILLEQLTLDYKNAKKNNGEATIVRLISKLAKGSTDSGFSGQQGELTAALNFAVNDMIAQKIPLTLENLENHLNSAFVGKSTGKIDLKVPFGKKTITLSVKNYEPLRDDDDLFERSFRDLTIQSSSNLINFLNYLSTNLDKDLKFDKVDIDQFTIDLINLFYFRYKNYTDTKEQASEAIEYFRDELKKLLSIYAPLYLMIGTKNKIGKDDMRSFYQRISDDVLEGRAAIFFYISGQGIIPMSVLIKMLFKETDTIKKAFIEMHAVNVETNVSAVDEHFSNNDYRRSKKINAIKGKEVIKDRYNLYASGGTTKEDVYAALGTKIQLKIQMSALKQYVPV